MIPAEHIDLAGVPNESIVSNNFHNGEENEGPNVDPFGLFFESRSNAFHDLYNDIVSSPFQAFDDEEIRKILGPVEPKEKVFPVGSFEILRKHGRKRLRSNGQGSSSIGSQTQSSFGRDQMLSTERIIELGAEKFISLSSRAVNHPYHSSLLGHSGNVESITDVQLIHNLLSCAEKVSEKKYERAIKSLQECERVSSCTGTPIQRLVFYFTEALYEKIDREVTREKLQGMGKMTPFPDPVEELKCLDYSVISFHEKHPLSPMVEFPGIQAVLDHLGEASKVHVIDLEIRKGVQCIILMQALASRHENPVSHLKITALGLKSNAQVEETGRRLMEFAESLNFNLSYNIVTVEDLLDLEASHFELSDDEAVAVYSAYMLAHMIGRADQLEHLMEVIKNINPLVMIVAELEVNVNSPTFVGRFVEALFFYGAFLESLADCMESDEMSRRKVESSCLRTTIRNILAAEGGERKVRHVGIRVWRAFFARFGLVETELSMSSVLQADLLRRRFPSGSSCTLGVNGKCLTIGWKGTPLSSVSAWKFG